MDQMDMLAMMDQMEKLQELSPCFSDGSLELSSNINGYNDGPCESIYGPITGAPLLFMAHVNAEAPLMPPPAPPGASSSSSSSALSTLSPGDQKQSSVAAMREMIFRIAAMQPINIDPESVKPPKRRNVKISTDPQSVAARHRRERISEKIRTLQRLVPGGTKMDTASMLDEAIHYVKFLKTQVQSLERAAADRTNAGIGISGAGAYLSVGRSYQSGAGQMFLPPTQLLS